VHFFGLCCVSINLEKLEFFRWWGHCKQEPIVTAWWNVSCSSEYHILSTVTAVICQF